MPRGGRDANEATQASRRRVEAGRQGCKQHRGLRFCSIRVFIAAFQASGDSIHPLGIRLDCSPPRPTHVQGRSEMSAQEQNPSDCTCCRHQTKRTVHHLFLRQRARAARARWGQLVSGLHHGMTLIDSRVPVLNDNTEMVHGRARAPPRQT